MPETDEIAEDAPLTAEEILTFGPCVEAQVWTTVWLQERRAPIAVQVGRPKLGPVFADDGTGTAVIIRPCVSRGRRLRGLPPIYTPAMLEKNAGVFDGWPMFTDHVPAALTATLAKHGRSVKELAGQVLKGAWRRDFVQESDSQFGYQKGATVAQVWATPLVRRTVDNNPNLLHTSINAWPTSGKPGTVPWRPSVKGMIIEGIRRQPQGSVDYVVRGGAGGRLLVAEGLEDEGEWPELGEWSEDDTALVVSLAERLYASPAMPEIKLPTRPDQLKDWLAEHAEHLLPALEHETTTETTPPGNGGGVQVTEEDVRRLMQEGTAGMPTVEEFEERLRERTEETIATRETQRQLSERACGLIERAEGIPPKWKADLKARYSMLPSGPPSTLLVEAETDDKGVELTPAQVLEARVTTDLEHVRDLLAEATGKPRVKGEGGAKRDAGDAGKRKPRSAFWRERFVSMGLAESEDKAVEAFGGKVEG